MSVDEVTTIETSDEIDRWQWRCPAAHPNWEPTNRHFYCVQCARQAEQGADVEPKFDELHNQKTGGRSAQCPPLVRETEPIEAGDDRAGVPFTLGVELSDEGIDRVAVRVGNIGLFELLQLVLELHD